MALCHRNCIIYIRTIWSLRRTFGFIFVYVEMAAYVQGSPGFRWVSQKTFNCWTLFHGYSRCQRMTICQDNLVQDSSWRIAPESPASTAHCQLAAGPSHFRTLFASLGLCRGFPLATTTQLRIHPRIGGPKTREREWEREIGCCGVTKKKVEKTRKQFSFAGAKRKKAILVIFGYSQSIFDFTITSLGSPVLPGFSIYLYG